MKVQSSGQWINQYFTINPSVSGPLLAGRASVAFALLTAYWLTSLIKVEDSRMDDL